MIEQPVRRIAVIGTGLIGASWALLFLARGLDVVATDPAPGAEEATRRAVEAGWSAMERLGLSDRASPDRLRFVTRPEDAAAAADFVQENGPERLDLKRDLFARMDAAAPAHVILASSTSTIQVSQVQSACPRHPGRVLLGHPFNPPHLIPLVEVAGGDAGTEEAIEAAMSFYRAVGKHPIRLRKEVPGHVANRLQAALWQEAFHLVQSGVVSVADLDAAIAHGPGLRWALLGPFLNLHLSGGPGGLAALFDKPLWAATQALWRDLGSVTVNPALAREVADGVAAELGGQGTDGMVAARDDVLLQLLAAKAGTAGLP
ncbi:3-hydroxyacyl-CoA dehydrogenase NAD-binding domain-containing protein [Roseomonas sp. CCTCC AB2023176]|uniref:3-hydroxyacyl-CoA dehydrogenase NAD-binding domain-containing protein n=1 Tax=Roseomonas sp. CCTCC AB2023176 TaxID=3342640 RepID=UPI0035D851B1